MPAAGNLRKKITILELDSQYNVWTWVPFHETMAQIERLNKRSIFSAVALAAVPLELILRPQKISLANSILWGDQQLYITAVEQLRYAVKVNAAPLQSVTVEQRIVRFERNELNNPVPLDPEIISFPAWLTEKYVKANRDVPRTAIETGYVLIVPKAIPEIPTGDIIDIDGKAYAVEVRHLLDPDRNEYEVVLWEDA